VVEIETRDEFQYGERFFSKPEIVTSQPWIEYIPTKFGLLISVSLLKRGTSPDPKP